MSKSVFNGSSGVVLSNKSLAEKVYTYLEKGIVSMKYTPGTVLNEYLIANHLNLSRSPVREALLRLEQMSLVTRDGKNRVVANITEEDILHNYELWEMIEPFCVSISCQYADSDLLDDINALLNKMEQQKDKNQVRLYRDNNLKFHRMLVEPCKNKLMLEYHASIINRIRWGFNYSLSRISEVGHSNISHHQIFEAYVKHERKKVEMLLRTHINEAAFRIRQKFQELDNIDEEHEFNTESEAVYKVS
ncbi:MAG: GntR family transcriptional regulator [Treponema sp.]|jgi:DNA-binding GntR family transcriptional regulator|nr:GntR family transcriptional regulator [Treponema sp.]